MTMFCNQCEQTAHGTGCTKVGVCGKSPEVAALQDLLVNALLIFAREPAMTGAELDALAGNAKAKAKAPGKLPAKGPKR